MMDYEELILIRQEESDEDYNEDAEIHSNRPLEEIYPQLFR